jgi:hypothetical protein
MARRRCVPPSLPFLISGLESSLHRRLFYHFTHVMSRVLTTFGDYSNLMNSIIIPLALADQTVMKILLSLSYSHLLKLKATGMSPELSAERNRLHQKTLQIQTQRIQALKRTAASIGSQSSSTDSYTIFATFPLFCLYEICEGTGGNGWRRHLKMAREPPSITSTATMHPFLLEFFSIKTLPPWSRCLLRHDALTALPNFSIFCWPLRRIYHIRYTHIVSAFRGWA